MKRGSSKITPLPDGTPYLFDIAKPVASERKIDRPFAAQGVFLGTSSFTASGWQSTFYPPGTKSADYLKYYATQFQTVEIDSTFYGIPSVETVKCWHEKTPADFIFAAKVPQAITHEKILLDCEEEWKNFLATMEILGEKLGPLLLQFGRFEKSAFKNANEFLARLKPFLGKLPKGHRFAVEIRNKNWLDARFADTLREHNVALALTDHSWMPRPWEIPGKFDWVTSDFAYVRWLGDRKGIEEVTKTWEKTVVDRHEDLTNWVEIFRQFVTRNLKVFGYANNHYAGHAPTTVKMFSDLFEKR
jgi:uncharacterized protein YecE (DUF72 family)